MNSHRTEPMIAHEDRWATACDSEELRSELREWYASRDGLRWTQPPGAASMERSAVIFTQSSPLDRSPDPLMLFQSEPAAARIRDVEGVGVSTLFSHHYRDATGSFDATPTPSRPWFAITISLLLGIVVGFASGYTAVERLAQPRVAATDVMDPAAETSSPPPAASPPWVTNSSAAGDAAPGNPDSAAVPPWRSATGPESTSAAGQGSIEFVSRPSDAQVSLDGRVVGKTPLSMVDVRKGMHDVLIELPGYNRWTTSVLVTPDNRTRVGASLEPSVPQVTP